MNPVEASFQTLATLLIVGLATAYLVRRGYRTLMARRSSVPGCGSCSSCPVRGAKAAPAERPMVSIDSLLQPPRPRPRP